MATKYQIHFTKEDWGSRLFSMAEVQHRIKLWQNWLSYLIDQKIIFEEERVEFDMHRMHLQSRITINANSTIELASAIEKSPFSSRTIPKLAACA